MAVIGIDEVGRGAWAGPMLVCAVKLLNPIQGLADSKIISKNKRQDLAIRIVADNPVGYGWVTASEIDDYGLSVALKIAAAKALNEIDSDECEIIIDGTIQFYDLLPLSKTLVKADKKIAAVSAASIVAKVARDKRMVDYARDYPLYAFDNNAGYGTRFHHQAIEKHGLIAIHRRSFHLPKQSPMLQ